jgi:carbon-monoxide dehydrogenase small subunit
MLMAALDLLERTASPSDDDIREAIHGNFCRCTGYQSIVTSIRDGAARMRGEPGTSWSGEPVAAAADPAPENGAGAG